MQPILARQLIRLALVLASLAWLAFVLTQTIGDPSRGEAVADAVLADPAARAEVAAPIASSVMSTFGLPADQRPLVESQVDRLLATPTGSTSFVDPFAGSWARLLGDDDPRPAEFDLAPLLDQFAAETGAPVDQLSLPDRLLVPAVPMPRTQLDWMAGTRSAVEVAVLPLTLAAAVLFAIAFALGERARALRRLGVWALVAGGSWLVIAPVAVWLTGRWAPGADAVVAAALEEATSGLLGVAIAFCLGGACALALSFVVGPPQREPARRAHRDRRVPVPGAPPPAAPVAEPVSGGRSHGTAEMPVDLRPVPPPARGASPPTVPQGADGVSRTDGDDAENADSVWEFYA